MDDGSRSDEEGGRSGPPDEEPFPAKLPKMFNYRAQLKDHSTTREHMWQPSVMRRIEANKARSDKEQIPSSEGAIAVQIDTCMRYPCTAQSKAVIEVKTLRNGNQGWQVAVTQTDCGPCKGLTTATDTASTALHDLHNTVNVPSPRPTPTTGTGSPEQDASANSAADEDIADDDYDGEEDQPRCLESPRRDVERLRMTLLRGSRNGGSPRRDGGTSSPRVGTHAHGRSDGSPRRDSTLRSSDTAVRRGWAHGQSSSPEFFTTTSASTSTSRRGRSSSSDRDGRSRRSRSHDRGHSHSRDRRRSRSRSRGRDRSHSHSRDRRRSRSRSHGRDRSHTRNRDRRRSCSLSPGHRTCTSSSCVLTRSFGA